MEYLGHTNLHYSFRETVCVCICVFVRVNKVSCILVTLKLMHLLSHCKDVKIAARFSYILKKYML